MMIKFPGKFSKGPDKLVDKYYKIYYMYIHNILKEGGFGIQLTKESSIKDTCFWSYINNKKVVFDYSPHMKVWDTLKFDAYFKLQNRCGSVKLKKVFPFPPVSFHNWNLYNKLSAEIVYDAQGNSILNRQKGFGAAKLKCNGVQSSLQRIFGNKFKTKLIPQEDYWFDINNCLVAVFVPGCYNDILDRGHMQYLGFGCCIISPYIATELPFKKKLVPFNIDTKEVTNEHYIQCKGDYSDINDIVSWCFGNRDKLQIIGRNAKVLFNKTCTPKATREWVLECIKEPKK